MNNNNSSNSNDGHAWSGYFWQQYEQGKIEEENIPVTEREKTLARLLDAWKAATTTTEQTSGDDDDVVCANSLEHTCSSGCSWKHIDSELSVCLDSNNYHVCTATACRHRIADSSDGHEVCELTGRIREEVQYAVPTYGTRDGGGAEQVTFEATASQRPGDTSTQQNTFSTRKRSFIEGVVYNIIQSVLPGLDKNLAQQVADLCVMIYYQAIDKPGTTNNNNNDDDDQMLSRAKKRQRVSSESNSNNNNTDKDSSGDDDSDDDEEEDKEDKDKKKQQQSVFHTAVDTVDIYAGVVVAAGQQQQKRNKGRNTKKRKRRRKHRKNGSKRLPSSQQVEKFCIVLLSDLASEGVTIHVPNKQTKNPEPLQVIPPSAAIRQHWPGTARLGDMWDIEVSKDVHASLTLMGAARLRTLASIIRDKAYTLFTALPSSSSQQQR
jgi:hypothetical protein